ncbi:alpha/beta-hydrolase [Cucurbitaria berberidis CBS 394.84]|uniref:Acyl-protein thioesterase 1 n=1 Tax=Cucurbitaria berberidis CBS 394.84 TaxID=1168544 RepID=A0A9P4GER8_9PLEO|nr:alpha/beta-hydrolase [Cucurbitaria berberidis CBS 394.84]KAF1844032.1 alpha/beta-hydrolase [Cucurbitaria berberidis CBS 394.84]
MSTERRPPIIIKPSTPPTDVSNSAAFVFVHGLGDEAEGVEDIARQFQAAGKLPHMTWYLPTRLSPYPPSRPELEEDEDEEGMLATVQYLTTLIDDLVQQGFQESRIVLGGFSQGHAMAILTGLVSKYAGKLGGLVGLSGYLPLSERISALRKEAGLLEMVNDNVEIFLARGTGDRLVPKRYHRSCYETLHGYGVKEE